VRTAICIVDVAPFGATTVRVTAVAELGSGHVPVAVDETWYPLGGA
jgi:hypothetical protein